MTSVFISRLHYIYEKIEFVYQISIYRNYVCFLQECYMYGFFLPFIAVQSVIVFPNVTTVSTNFKHVHVSTMNAKFTSYFLGMWTL